MVDWLAIPTAVASAIASAADFNKLGNNLRYLKGEGGGAITLEGNPSVSVASGNATLRLVNAGARVLELINDRAGNTFRLGEESVRTILSYDAAGNTVDLPNSPLKNLGLRVHRHPYSSNRHVETGSFAQAGVTAGGYADVAITFADAYASAPIVVATPVGTPTSPQHMGVVVQAISTTGATLRVMNGGGSTITFTCHWVAEGAD